MHTSNYSAHHGLGITTLSPSDAKASNWNKNASSQQNVEEVVDLTPQFKSLRPPMRTFDLAHYHADDILRMTPFPRV